MRIIEVPEGEKLFIWTTSSSVTPIVAPSMQRAVEVALLNRVEKGGQTPEEAIGWFHKDDQLVEVDSRVMLWAYYEGFVGSHPTRERLEAIRLALKKEGENA